MEPIKYRQDDTSSTYIYTGYNPQPSTNPNPNENALIFQLPPELVLNIMECLDPEDLFFTIQSSKVFRKLFSNGAFKHLHERVPRPSSHPLQEDLPDNPKPAPGSTENYDDDLYLRFARKALLNPRQPLKFGRFLARLAEWGLCNDCTANGAPLLAPRFAYCTCRWYDKWYREWSRHPRSFATKRVAKRSNLPIERQGSMALCAHRRLKLGDRFKVLPQKDGYYETLFRCAECPAQLGLAERDEAPNLYRNGCNQLSLSWKITVCTVEEGQVLTKDLLRASLRKLQDTHASLLCPHVSFYKPGFFLRPFEKDRCACFAEPSPTPRPCRVQHKIWQEAYFCCACANAESPTAAGLFMPYTSATAHITTCHVCAAEYRWRLDGRAVQLSAIRPGPYLNGGSRGRIGHWDSPFPTEWAAQMDPDSYDGHAGEGTCGDETCWNAVQRCYRCPCRGPLPER